MVVFGQIINTLSTLKVTLLNAISSVEVMSLNSIRK